MPSTIPLECYTYHVVLYCTTRPVGLGTLRPWEQLRAATAAKEARESIRHGSISSSLLSRPGTRGEGHSGSKQDELPYAD